MFHGSKHILLGIIIFPILCYSQSEELDNLVLKRIEIKSKILSLEDSLETIESRIEAVKTNAFKYVLEGSDEIYIYNCRPTTRLRKEAWPSSEIIKEFEEYTDVILLGFEGDYLKVDTPFGRGFIHRTYATQGKRLKATNTEKSSSTRSNFTETKKVSSKPKSKRSTRRLSKSTYRRYYRGPRGGCYYINSNGNKTYVARSLCN